MKRREFIALLGGAAASPLVAHAQEHERLRRVGILMSVAADGPEGQARLVAFTNRLQQLGWTDGRNVRIDVGMVSSSQNAAVKPDSRFIAKAQHALCVGTLPPGFRTCQICEIWRCLASSIQPATDFQANL